MPARVLLILLSAVSYALAFPPWNLGFVAFVALVPLLHTLRGLRPRTGLLVGFLWGTASHWAIAWWAPPAITFYYDQSPWFGIAFSVVSSPVFWAGYCAIFAGGACWMSRRSDGIARVVLLSCIWVTCEYARARLLTGAPWLMLGYALVPYPALMQAADLGGVYLLSLAAVAVNAALAEAIGARVMPSRRRLTIPLAFAAAIVLALHVYGVWRLSMPLPGGASVRVAVVQGNNEAGAHWQPGSYGSGLDDYLRMSLAAAERFRPAVIVWPEAAVPMFLAHEPIYRERIARVMREAGVDLILGAPHYEDADPAVPRYLNSAFHVIGAGELRGRYDKTHLLPFVEYFPLRTIGFLRRRFERVRTFVPGQGSVLLETRLGKTAVVICFEAIFPELVRERMRAGAEVLVNLSNDVWLGRGAGPAQHFEMVRLRAVENRTWVIRATTTGISAIVDPYGRSVEQAPAFEPAVIAADVVPMSVATIYERFGDWLAYGCVLVALLAVLGCRFTR